MKRLICSYCGLDKWNESGMILASNPPVDVYYCAHCGKATAVRIVAPENRPHVIYVPDEGETDNDF